MIRSYLHTAIIFIWVVAATAVMGLAATVASFFSRNGNLPHLVARAWARSILFVSGIRVTVEGREHIRPGRSYIYMPNHQSNFDIPVLLGALDVQFRWLAKAELFKIPILSRGMRGCGYISIDRSNRRSAIASLQKAAETIRAGTSVLIFPEGTRSRDGAIREFKKGGFILAVDSGVPIVPIVLHGTWAIMPRNRLRIEPRTVVLEIQTPIETAAHTRKSKEDLLAQVRSSIRTSFEAGKAAKS